MRHQRSYAEDEDDDSYRFGGSRTPSHETLGVRHGGIERNRPRRRTVQTSRDTPIIIVTSPSSSSGQFTTSSRGQSRTPSQRPQSGSRSRSDGTRLTPAQADYYRSPRYRAEPRFTPAQADYYMSPRYRAEPRFTPEQADYYRSPRYRRSTWTSTWHVCRVSARMTSCVFGRTTSTQAATSSRCVFA